jgi:tetratricopeptide (TPR) repeat protein
MKNLISKISLSLIIAMVLSGSFAFANGPFGQKSEEKVDKTTLKARDAIKKASPDDWMTYAKSAEKCLKKNVNLKEAAEWIDRSLEITEAPYNLTIKGDYYLANNLKDKALEMYVKGLRVGQEQNPSFDGTFIQERIAEIYQLN